LENSDILWIGMIISIALKFCGVQVPMILNDQNVSPITATIL